MKNKEELEMKNKEELKTLRKIAKMVFIIGLVFFVIGLTGSLIVLSLIF